MAEITSAYFENLLVKFLYTNQEVRDRVLPYLNKELFDESENISILKHIESFDERFQKFPTLPETKLDINDKESWEHLKKCIEIDTSEYEPKFIIGEIETFLKKKMVNKKYGITRKWTVSIR